MVSLLIVEMDITNPSNLDLPKLFKVSHIGLVFFTISSFQFQLVTICHRLISFFFKPFFQLVPIFSCSLIIFAISQYVTHINDGEEPLLQLIIPYCANLPVFKQLYQLFLCHILESSLHTKLLFISFRKDTKYF